MKKLKKLWSREDEFKLRCQLKNGLLLCLILLFGFSMHVNADDSRKIKIQNASSQSIRVVIYSKEQLSRNLWSNCEKEILIEGERVQTLLLSRNSKYGYLYIYYNNTKYDIHIESQVPERILISDEKGLQLVYPGTVESSREHHKRKGCIIL